ncbi:MAG: hypothetical protein ACREOI_03290 [bacterium]
MQIALLRSGGIHRKAPSPEEQAVQDLGRRLFDAFVTDEVRSCYDMSQREAAQKDMGLRLKLRIQSPEIAALLWQFLNPVCNGKIKIGEKTKTGGHHLLTELHYQEPMTTGYKFLAKQPTKPALVESRDPSITPIILFPLLF